MSRACDTVNATPNGDLCSELGTSWLQTPSFSIPSNTSYCYHGYQSSVATPEYVSSCRYCNPYETCRYHDNSQRLLYGNLEANLEDTVDDELIESFLSDGPSCDNTDPEHNTTGTSGEELFMGVTSTFFDSMPEPMTPYYPEEILLLDEQQAKDSTPKVKTNRKTTHKSHTCGLCMLTLPTRTEYSLHIKNTHKQSSYACDICHKTFRQLTTMRTHRRQHTGERPYTCTTCNRAFSDHSSFIKHKRIHSNERPYTCHYCDRSFIQSGNCRRHMKSIHGCKH